MIIAIEEVRNGDVIVEGRDETKVSKHEVAACSSKGTHVNGRYCYDRGQLVQVKRGARKDVEETGLGDLEEDSPFSDKTLFDNLRKQAS